MKTILEWLQELPEPYRSEAIENVSKTKRIEKRKCLEDALLSAFPWEETKQGGEYWNNLHTKIS
jgi:tryptophanase